MSAMPFSDLRPTVVMADSSPLIPLAAVGQLDLLFEYERTAVGQTPIKARSNALAAPTRIEPCLFESDVPAGLTDLAVEIQAESASIGRNLNEDSLAELADLVRIMNSYYSNLIEGHNTRPRDIERALADQEVEQDKRPLALEAKAHVEVQRAIDIAHRSGKLPVPVSAKFISWVHKCFYDEMPEEFRFAERKDGTKIQVVPGKFRSEPGDDVDVGWHQPPSSAMVASFMDYFERRFSSAEARADPASWQFPLRITGSTTSTRSSTEMDALVG